MDLALKDVSYGYGEKIAKRLRRKTLSLMRRSFQDGAQHKKASLNNFISKLEENVALVQRTKVDEIITRAQALVAQAQQRDPTIVVAMMHKLLRNIAEHTDVEITAHPADLILIREALGENGLGQVAVRKVVLQEDESFSRASLIVKANKSIIDAHVHTQLERARTILLQRLLTKGSHGDAY